MAVAGMAGYYSIYGLMLIFSGSPIEVAVAAGALEVGKLVLTSILYNYYKKIHWSIVAYGTIAVLGLMLITSWGVYGFLSAAYQKSQAPLEQVNERIVLLEKEYDRKTARLQQMDDIIAGIGANYITKRLEEKAQQAPERTELTARINQIETEKLELSNKRLETEVHIGPIVKIAEAFGVSRDKAVHWLIMVMIFVFDPLAVVLTLCLNAILKHKREEQSNDNNDDGGDDPTPPTKTSSKEEPVVEEPQIEEPQTDVQTESPKTLEQLLETVPEPEKEPEPSLKIGEVDDTILQHHEIEIKGDVGKEIVQDEVEEPEEEPQTIIQHVESQYDDSELKIRLDRLAQDMDEYRNTQPATTTQVHQDNPLRNKLVNDVRSGNVSES